MFSVLLSVISSLIAYLELSMALVHINIVRQRIRNNFRQSLMSKDTRKATRRSQPYKQRRFWTRPGRTSAWWDNFVNEVVVAEEWRENFRMSRRNLLKLSELLRPHIEGDISSFEKFNEARRTQRNPREQLAVEGTIAGSMFCLLEHAQSEIRQLRLR